MDLVGKVFTALLTNYARGKWAETTAEGHLMEMSMFLSQPVQKNDTWKTAFCCVYLQMYSFGANY